MGTNHDRMVDAEVEEARRAATPGRPPVPLSSEARRVLSGLLASDIDSDTVMAMEETWRELRETFPASGYRKDIDHKKGTERAIVFEFFCVDDDRSWGHDNHVFSLGYVGHGTGLDPGEAFEQGSEAGTIHEEFRGQPEGLQALPADTREWLVVS